jgi:hypothetical protein
MSGGATDDGVFWRDPEEFLDAVESAAAGSVASQELLRTDRGDVSIDTLVDMGRRALAIECSHFLRGANLASERWLPYRRWGNGLASRDTVVTFNYDLIPDLLGKVHDRLPDSNLKIVVPSNLDLHDAISGIRQRSVAPVLKLHGSVNWLATNGTIAAVDESDDLPITCPRGRDLVLGVPGPGKVGLRDEFKPIATLWAAAMKAIRVASRVVFVGYRFPPTDAQARTEILDAMNTARIDSCLKSVEIVLGPDTNHQDVARVRGLLGFKLPPSMVKVLPLFAEDFLALDRSE